MPLGQYSAQHSTDGTGWIKLNILDWTVAQKKNARETMHEFHWSLEVIAVWMDINFLVLMTIPWLWKMLTFRGTGVRGYMGILSTNFMKSEMIAK